MIYLESTLVENVQESNMLLEVARMHNSQIDQSQWCVTKEVMVARTVTKSYDALPWTDVISNQSTKANKSIKTINPRWTKH